MEKGYKTVTNREKFAEQILDIACGGSKIAVDKATLEPMKSWQIGFITCAILKRMKSLISRFIILTQRRKRKYTTVTAIYLIGFNQKHNRRKYGQIFIQGKKT